MNEPQDQECFVISRAGAERALGPVTVKRREHWGSTLQERLILPDRSQRVVNHSPDGFEFGYHGSGPAQLALAIMLEVTNDKRRAHALYQNFKTEFIAPMQHPGGEIPLPKIIEWIAKQEK